MNAGGNGVCSVPRLLPSTSAGLNPIEPKGVHGKRAVLEPARVMGAQGLAIQV